MANVTEIEQKRQEIQQYISDITSEQASKYAHQVIRLDLLKKYKTKYLEDFNDFNVKDLFVAACKSLDYTKPYRIAVIGNTGVGKSTFNNSLVGRNLLFTRAEGKAATGTVLEIFFIAQDDQEIAIVKYRHQAEIKDLINKVLDKLNEKNFIRLQDLQKFINSHDLDNNFIQYLENLISKPHLSREDQNLFEQYKNTIIDIVKQYAEHGNLKDKTFYLNNPEDLHKLNQLTDENSSLNDSLTGKRKIGLIKKVIYKIKSNVQDGNLGLHFPSNVCLVDLPGLDGSLLHNLIITEGIKDADAVIYINDPRRIDTNTDLLLLSEVKNSITLTNNKDSYKGIFFVLTSRDNITRDENYDPTQLPNNMKDFIDKFLSGYTDYLSNRDNEGNSYFYISSIAANYSQKLLRGEQLDSQLRDTYERACIGLKIRNYDDYEAVLRASRMPKLLEKLKHFVLMNVLSNRLIMANLLSI